MKPNTWKRCEEKGKFVSTILFQWHTIYFFYWSLQSYYKKEIEYIPCWLREPYLKAFSISLIKGHSNCKSHTLYLFMEMVLMSLEMAILPHKHTWLPLVKHWNSSRNWPLWSFLTQLKEDDRTPPDTSTQFLCFFSKSWPFFFAFLYCCQYVKTEK